MPAHPPRSRRADQDPTSGWLGCNVVIYEVKFDSVKRNGTATEPQGDHITMFRTIVAPALLVLGMNVGALGARAETKPKVFSFARTTSEKTIDPQAQLDGASSDIVMNVYDALLQYNYLKRPYTIEPNLVAKMPELGADKVTLTFELKKGVFFIDDECFPGGKGRELTADDVIYSIKRFADANINNQSWFFLDGAVVGLNEFREATKKTKTPDYAALDVAGLKKVDSHKFTIKLTKPNPLAIYPFAASSLSIVPREAVEKYKGEFAANG